MVSHENEPFQAGLLAPSSVSLKNRSTRQAHHLTMIRNETVGVSDADH